GQSRSDSPRRKPAAGARAGGPVAGGRKPAREVARTPAREAARKPARTPARGAARAPGGGKPVSRTRPPAARGGGAGAARPRGAASTAAKGSQRRTGAPRAPAPTQRQRRRRAQPKTRGGRTIIWLFRRWWLWAAAGFAAGAVAVFALFIGNVPLPAALPAAQSAAVLYADGSVQAPFRATDDRVIVPLHPLSVHLRHARP